MQNQENSPDSGELRKRNNKKAKTTMLKKPIDDDSHPEGPEKSD
jgi:hypothetical protein